MSPVELAAEREIKEMPINEVLAEWQGSPPPFHEIVLGDSDEM